VAPFLEWGLEPNPPPKVPPSSAVPGLECTPVGCAPLGGGLVSVAQIGMDVEEKLEVKAMIRQTLDG
jgi:hypothetical protein